MKGKIMDVGLARVSTRDQNPALQITALEQAGCDVIHEERVSGVSKKRPVRDQVLRGLQRGDTLTIWKLDRLGRSAVELLDIARDLEQRGIKLRITTQGIDTSTTMGRFFLTLLAGFAEMERELMRERVLAGKAEQRAQGRPMGPIPFGWTDASTINVDQAEILREAGRRLLDGEPLGRIVDDFNARGLNPGRKATRWRSSHLRRLLLNPATAPILGEDDHVQVSRRLHGDRPVRGNPNVEHLLSGILSCPCGQPLYAAQKAGKTGKVQMVYRCRKGSNSGGRFAGCGTTSISQTRADAWAEEMFLSSIVGEDFQESLNQRQAELLAGDATAEELDIWRAERAELEQVQGTRFYTDELRRRHQELERLVREATAQLMAQPDLQALIDLPRSEEQLRERWASWTVAERRAWLRRLVECIEVKPASSRSRASATEDRLTPIFKL